MAVTALEGKSKYMFCRIVFSPDVVFTEDTMQWPLPEGGAVMISVCLGFVRYIAFLFYDSR